MPLTDLDGELFDGAGVTKRDLVTYLDGVRDRILPGLAGRALSVVRVRPGSKPFMQKNLPSYAPDWVQHTDVWSHASKREVRYPLCDDRRTLVWLANQRAVEYHPAMVPEGSDHASHLVIDLDPPGDLDGPAGFALAARTALLVREVLDGVRARRRREDQRCQGDPRVRAARRVAGLRGRRRRHPRAGRPHRAARPRPRDHGVRQGRPRRPGVRRLDPRGRRHRGRRLQPAGAPRPPGVVPGRLGRPADGRDRPTSPSAPRSTCSATPTRGRRACLRRNGSRTTSWPRGTRSRSLGCGRCTRASGASARRRRPLPTPTTPTGRTAEVDSTSPAARALAALEALSDSPGITAERLAWRLGVSERAVRRYVRVLRDAGIPVESTHRPLRRLPARPRHPAAAADALGPGGAGPGDGRPRGSPGRGRRAPTRSAARSARSCGCCLPPWPNRSPPCARCPAARSSAVTARRTRTPRRRWCARPRAGTGCASPTACRTPRSTWTACSTWTRGRSRCGAAGGTCSAGRSPAVRAGSTASTAWSGSRCSTRPSPRRTASTRSPRSRSR